MDPVSEFKFACPVCGQHLLARVEEAGQTTECPSCFKQLTIPQAPMDGGTKLIISAALASTRRVPTVRSVAPKPQPTRRPVFRAPLTYILLGVVAVGLAIGLLVFKHRGSAPDRGDPGTNDLWTDKADELELLNPPAVGRLNGRDFALTSSIWRDTTLILYQDEGQPNERRLRITFPLRGGELVSGKTFQVGPDDSPSQTPLKITWTDAAGKEQSGTVSSGYILRVQFDEVSKSTVAGRLHICFSDPEKSWVAGTFSATNMTTSK